LRLFAALLPFLTLPVTAVFNLLPGLAFLYARTPFLVIPAPLLVGRKLADLPLVVLRIGLDLALVAIH
jgi:hypothetical protein